MCHLIETTNTQYGKPIFLQHPERRDYCFGQKMFRITADSIKSYYLGRTYDVRWVDGWCILTVQPDPQIVRFEIASAEGNSLGCFLVEQKIACGMHVSPFFWKDKCISPVPDANRPPLYNLLVCFNTIDVLFYDGIEISVRQILIPYDPKLCRIPEYILELSPNRFADSFEAVAKLRDKLTS